MEEGALKQEILNKKVREDCWATIFSLFKELNLQRRQSTQEESTEEEEMKQQQRMMILKNLTKKISSEGRMVAKNRWWVSELLTQVGKILCRHGFSGWRR